MMPQLARYRITGELGRGGMGVVYRAVDPTIGRNIAIKLIRLSDFTDADEKTRLRERLLREAQSAGRLSHPNIVTIYDAAEEGEHAFIAMECIDGVPLDKLSSRGDVVSGKDVFAILKQAAAALDYAHQNEVVHRDIKPGNIMVTREGTVKIADFGVAKILSQQATQAAGVIGTPNYMSPEQVEGSPLDGRADQFSLAVVAYELITGERPFVAESVPSLLYKIVHEEPIAPQNINPTLGWQVETVIRRALSKDPRKRYGACSEFVAALESACNLRKDWKPLSPGSAQSLPTVVAASPAVPVEPRPRRVRDREPERSSKPVALVVALALLAAAGGGYFVWRYLGTGAQTAATETTQQAAAPKPTEAPPPAAPTADTSAPPPQPDAAAESQPQAEATTKAQTELPTVAGEQPATDETRPVRAAPAAERVNPVSLPDAPEIEMDVRSEPPGAVVVIDNRARSACRAPCRVPLAPGEHIAVATMPGHRSVVRKFTVPGTGSLLLVMGGMTGMVTVNSIPAGASIFINGAARPEKTPAMLKLPAGRYKIAVVKDGSGRDEMDVEVKDGAMKSINVDFGGVR